MPVEQITIAANKATTLSKLAIFFCKPSKPEIKGLICPLNTQVKAITTKITSVNTRTEFISMRSKDCSKLI